MSTQDINRSGEMEVFTRVVELGGFSAAARAFRISPSAVSKLVARLEARLGVRLINRSTRKLQLTPEGSAYYDRSIRILDDINTAEREAAIGAMPRGQSASTPACHSDCIGCCRCCPASSSCTLASASMFRSPTPWSI